MFSGLNNPDNITLGEDYGTICGYTTPNYEVKEFLISNLLSVYTRIMGGHLKKLKDKTCNCILNKDSEGLKEVLEEIYSQTSYQNKKKSEGNKNKSEGLYHSL
jgi:hypothetical protein